MIRKHENDHAIEYQLENGDLHRANGPARIWKPEGNVFWYLYGGRHRYYGSYHVGSMWFIHGEFIK